MKEQKSRKGWLARQWQQSSHLLLGLFLVIGILIGGAGGWFGRTYGWIRQNGVNAAEIGHVQQLLKNNFDGDVDPQKLSEGQIRGLVASLGDPYTVFLDKSEAQALSDDLQGKLSGIGVEVGLKNNRLTVISPIDDTPAAKAGLRSGDVIALIDGQDSSQLTLDEAVKKIRGQEGTSVKLTVIRGTDKPIELEIQRQVIQVSSVKSEIKDGNVGYIRLRRFGDDTDQAIRTAATDLANKGVKSVVLDLRDNPGGYLDSAVSVSSEFLASGTVVEERSRHFESRKLVANPGGNLTNVKLIVLINGGSASASEIVAGALKDQGRATLVGEKSFGKGSVQEVKPLDSGGQVKITVAHWYTPNGVNISKEGIKPDVEVKLTNEDYNADQDPQLNKALELARS